MQSPLSIIIGREYWQRVRRKSFIITTIITPLLFVLFTSLPSIIMLFGSSEERTIAVIDDSGIVAPVLKAEKDTNLKYVFTDSSLDELRNNTDYEAVLVVGADIVSKPDQATLYTRGAASLETESAIRHAISDAVEEQRLKAYDIPDLKKIIEETKVDIDLKTYRIDSGSDEETSSLLSFILGEAMSFLLYMFLLLYGQMVMNSIIEEKNNRVLELVVSSVDPTRLMFGKIIGIGLVAVTQVLIWVLIIALFSILALPSMAAGLAAEGETDILAALTQLSNPGYIIGICSWLLVFLIGGYLFYAAIFAAIGSAVDNVQDASQLTSLPMIPIMAGIFLSFAVVKDPNSALSFWSSIIPLTSPMVMLTRIPFGVDLWEIILSVALLYASVIFLVWFAAKIYRVGILMYGKKPNVVELIRWARYK